MDDTARETNSVHAALETALKAALPADQDAATVALAKRYATELDDAAVISVATTKALQKLRGVEGADEVYDQLLQLAARIEEVHVAGLIGPKFLAALTELQMTPKARAAIAKGGGDGSDRPKSALDELRDRRASRTASLDAPAT